ncbi:MAG: PP2C family protein-serine/threonine phosphatase [Anaerolineales bacterium]
MTPLEHAHLQIAAVSHPGETGKNNEDRYSVTAELLGGRLPSVLAVVADGIGGHLAGEVASQLTVDTIVARLQHATGRFPVRELRSAVIDAARAVSRASQETEERRGMGSTVAAAWVLGDRLFTAFVGDSRIYWMRQGILRQTSVDHTWIQEALEHNVITEEEARDHPNAHVLRRHLGGSQVPDPDLRLRLSATESEARSRANQGLRLRPGDQVLLCTDGLTDLVSESETRGLLAAHPPQEAAQQLVDLARARGGHDNITVVLLTVPPRAAVPVRKRLGRRLAAGAAGVLALLTLVVFASAVGWWVGLWPWGRTAPVTNPGAATSAATIFSGLPSSATAAAPGSASATPYLTPTRTSTPFPLPTVPAATP